MIWLLVDFLSLALNKEIVGTSDLGYLVWLFTIKKSSIVLRLLKLEGHDLSLSLTLAIVLNMALLL